MFSELFGSGASDAAHHQGVSFSTFALMRLINEPSR